MLLLLIAGVLGLGLGFACGYAVKSRPHFTLPSAIQREQERYALGRIGIDQLEDRIVKLLGPDNTRLPVIATNPKECCAKCQRSFRLHETAYKPHGGHFRNERVCYGCWDSQYHATACER